MKKKISLFIALFSLLMTLSLIQSTYAKYSSASSASNELAIARWNIKINNQDVVKSSNFSTTIKPTIVEDSNIKEGVIAPTSTGYFDLVIDTTDTDVSMDYSIRLTNTNDSNVSDLKITKYVLNDVEFTGVVPSIEGSLDYTNTSRIIRIRFYFEWIDGNESDAMDNAADTQATVNGIAKYNLNVNFTQKKNG